MSLVILPKPCVSKATYTNVYPEARFSMIVFSEMQTLVCFRGKLRFQFLFAIAILKRFTLKFYKVGADSHGITLRGLI